MSAPNKSYDPVEVATLKVEYLKEVVADAVAAFARAATGDELKEARIAHAGDRSPLSLANREIGALPPAAKAEAGKRVAAARHEIVRRSLQLKSALIVQMRPASLRKNESMSPCQCIVAQWVRAIRSPLYANALPISL